MALSSRRPAVALPRDWRIAMPEVSPQVLRWARETAGLSLEEAVSKLNLRDAKGDTAVKRLQALEDGRTTPTRPLLAKMAKQYRRPLVVFYMSAPPQRGQRGQDCRSTTSIDRSRLDEALFDALLRRVHARMTILRSAMEEQEGTEPLAFVGSRSMEDGVPSVLASIRETLGMTLADFRKAPTEKDAFQILRARAEAVGVFVLLEGNLGSHHTNMDADVFRGFALADPVAPFAVVNPNDHPRAWAFTLLHELAHIWLGRTAVSGGVPELSIEQFCNDVASEYLLPKDELSTIRIPRTQTTSAVANIVADFARHRNVSDSMVAYRLYRMDMLTHADWQALSSNYRDKWMARHEDESRKNQHGPDYYVVRRYRLGKRMLEVVGPLLASGELTTTRAARLLAVGASNVHRVLSTYR